VTILHAQQEGEIFVRKLRDFKLSGRKTVVNVMARNVKIMSDVYFDIFNFFFPFGYCDFTFNTCFSTVCGFLIVVRNSVPLILKP